MLGVGGVHLSARHAQLRSALFGVKAVEFAIAAGLVDGDIFALQCLPNSGFAAK
jgi:hypothetical protein